MDFGLLTWRTAHALNLNLSCNVVSIGLRPWSCQLPSCNLLPHIAVLSSFGRETSLVNIMRLRSILPSLITSAIYFSLLFTIAIISITTITCVQSFVNYKAGGIDNLSVLVGSKVICICVQVLSTAKFLAPLTPTCRPSESHGIRSLASLLKGKHFYLLHLTPSIWGNQRGVRGPSTNNG